MLVKVQGRDAFYRPIAGTHPRGRDEKEDQRLDAADARRSKGASRAHHAGGSRAATTSGRVSRIWFGAGGEIDVRRALFARDAFGFEAARHACAPTWIASTRWRPASPRERFPARRKSAQWKLSTSSSRPGAAFMAARFCIWIFPAIWIRASPFAQWW